MLESAWLPRRASRRDSPCKLSDLCPLVHLDHELIDQIQKGGDELFDYFKGTHAVTPCNGLSYDLVYGIVRSLVLKGYAAKVVHLMDLESPPESRAGIEFMEGLENTDYLAVLGFYDGNEPKPNGTRKVSHLLQELDCHLLLEVSDVLDAQTWWSPEFIAALGDVNYIIRA